MERQPIPVSTKDVEKAVELGRFLKDKIKWDLTTEEVIKLSQLLLWYNNLPNLLKDNIIEVNKFLSKEELEKNKKGKT